MGIELHGTVTPGQRLFRAMVAAAMALPIGDRMRLLHVFQSGGSFAQLSSNLRATFEEVAATVQK